MGGCQNYGPFLGTLNIRCRTIIGTQKGTLILTTPHIVGAWGFKIRILNRVSAFHQSNLKTIAQELQDILQATSRLYSIL